MADPKDITYEDVEKASKSVNDLFGHTITRPCSRFDFVENLLYANQIAIQELGREIQEIKASHRRDMKDQWKMISELTDELKEAQVTINNIIKIRT